MFSVEMLPDDRVDAAVRADWLALIEAGLPSAGRHPSASNRPHVTVAVSDMLAPGAADGLRGLSDALPLTCSWGGATVFPAGERFVLARPLVVTADLLAFHRHVVGLLGPPPERYAITAIDAWTPHLTLARRMTGEQIGRALALLGAAPVTGAMTGLRLWDAEQKLVTPLR